MSFSEVAYRQPGGAGRLLRVGRGPATGQTGFRYQRIYLRPDYRHRLTHGKNSATSSGGDLMADLHAKLSMRRRGISGAEGAPRAHDTGFFLHTLSNLIPEPNETSPHHSSTEEDWD
ncbi:WASH complex subunit 1 [Eumeta japonica]|uniref:WASH complex subunit 1 n=1 Tax=Eumeta variegata TaxID=151549 RepID=A0A4C1V7Y3_EUMVA|nr:WASH complex subunit 1 [Eumeta japonica]